MRETSLDSSQIFTAARTPCRVCLPGRALIAVTGADAAHFLHAVLTAGIETLAPGAARLAALLTPQGKIIADMLVANASDEEPLYFLDVNRGFAEEVVRRLANYRLRAKVELALLDTSIEVHVLLDATVEAGENFYCFADPRDEGLGSRLYGPAAALAAAFSHLPQGTEAAYIARRIALAIPECGPDYPPSTSYPHEANMDQLGGIDFRKGCYIGQEIVSRMEHRATARTRTLLARFHNGFGVESGAEIRADDQRIGTLGLSAGPLALAQVRLDRWADALAREAIISGGGVALSLQKPAYARF